MKEILLLFFIILLFSCDKDHGNDYTKKDKVSSEFRKEQSISDVIEIAKKNSSENVLIELQGPLWNYKNNSLYISDGKSIIHSNQKNKLWSYLKSKFFLVLGKDLFKINEGKQEEISFLDLFKTEIVVDHKFKGGDRVVDMDGVVNFYEGRLHHHDDYERNRLWLNFYQEGDGRSKKIFSKKMVEGENYFFSTLDNKQREAKLYLDQEFYKILNNTQKRSKLVIEADKFFHKGLSKEEILQTLSDKYDLLFFYRKSLRVFLIKKNMSLRDALLKADREIQFDEYHVALSSSSMRRNQFVRDFPLNYFKGNNLDAEGILSLKKKYITKYGDINVHFYFEGSYMDIYSNIFFYNIDHQIVNGSNANFKLNENEVYQTITEKKEYKNIFKNVEKIIEYQLKKPELVCERYHHHFDKFCVTDIKKIKKKAKFRVYVGKKLKKISIIQDGFFPQERSHHEFEKRTVSVLGEKFSSIVEKDNLNKVSLAGVQLETKLNSKKCFILKIGYLGAVEIDEDYEPVKKQVTREESFCDGPEYVHAIRKISLDN